MKTYTVEQKIEEIQLGIRIERMRIKELQLDIKDSRLCDCRDKVEELHARKKLVENMEDRVEELGLIW